MGASCCNSDHVVKDEIKLFKRTVEPCYIGERYLKKDKYPQEFYKAVKSAVIDAE